MKPIVRSLLETDLYKFTMWQALLHRHPNAHGEYEFLCRNQPDYPLAELKEEVERELDLLCEMLFTDDEIAYLRSLRFIKSDFADFLTVFRFQRKFITVKTDGPHLRIRACGPVVHVMGFEIYVLYIVNELYFRRFDQQAAMVEARKRLALKIEQFREFDREPRRINPFEFFDFGVRRRFSGEWQDEVVSTLARELPQFFKGTSNVHLARKYNLVPIGTMAHEYLQAFQAFPVRLRDFQKAALEDWVQEYRGDLGTALTDVVGMDAFLADFDLYFAKLYDVMLTESYRYTVSRGFHRQHTGFVVSRHTARSSTARMSRYSRKASRREDCAPTSCYCRHEQDEVQSEKLDCKLHCSIVRASSFERAQSQANSLTLRS